MISSVEQLSAETHGPNSEMWCAKQVRQTGPSLVVFPAACRTVSNGTSHYGPAQYFVVSMIDICGRNVQFSE